MLMHRLALLRLRRDGGLRTCRGRLVPFARESWCSDGDNERGGSNETGHPRPPNRIGSISIAP